MSQATVLYDVPGPRARRRNRVLTAVFTVAFAALVALVAWKLGQKDQWAAQKWKPFLQADTSQLDAHGPLHVDPYPNTDAPGQRPECSAGNEPYSDTHATIGNPTENVGTKTEITHRTTG